MKVIAEVAVPVPLFPYKRFFDYRVPDELSADLKLGAFVTVPFGPRQTWGIVWKLKSESESKKLKSIAEIRHDLIFFDERRRKFAEWLADTYFYPVGEVCETMLPAGIRKASRKIFDKHLEKANDTAHGNLTRELNAQQKEAFHDILQAEQAQHLLWGVTGSGKTEIYLHLIYHMLNEGRGAIILVPEIALTPQLYGRFDHAFAGQIALFHSAQGEKEQRESWLDILKGNKKIALGPRSALFAPVKNLGLIILDEEHESSYKQEERLRYHARRSAEKLAQLSGSKLLLGSATPSAETLYRAKTEEMGLHKLNQRAVDVARAPTVKFVDLKKNLAVSSFEQPPEKKPQTVDVQPPQSLFLSDELRDELAGVLARGEQSILFLNRRGLGRAVVCRSCGFQPQCVQCAVNLIPHRNKLLCHYCGFECSTPVVCNACGKPETFREIGFGTEALEEEIQRHFPEARILRLDRDVVQDRETLLSTLKDFSDKRADILVGTQMVAKGHDFPQVSLVGVVMADVGFSMPDFRNEERVFQLLTQVAGRAGRGNIPGKVLIQTFRPDEEIFKAILQGESLERYEHFFMRLFPARKLLSYPPFAHIALLRFQGMSEAAVSRGAASACGALKKIKAADFIVLDSVPAPIAKVRNRYRYHILLKSKSEATLRKALIWISEKWITLQMEKKFEGTRLIVDVDPAQLM